MNRLWKWVTGSSRTGVASSPRPDGFRPSLESLDERVMPAHAAVPYGSSGVAGYFRGTNNQLNVVGYEDLGGGGFTIRNLGAPKAGVWLASDPGAVNYSGNNGTYAFVVGTDGHLYVNYHVSR